MAEGNKIKIPYLLKSVVFQKILDSLLAIETEHADTCTRFAKQIVHSVQCRCLGAVVEAEGDVAQDLFVGRDYTSHFVHGVDDEGFV